MIEARLRIHHGDTLKKMNIDPHKVHLATQDILSHSDYNQGCDGGFPYLASLFAEDFGIMPAKVCPYHAQSHSDDCSTDLKDRKKATVRVQNTRYVGGFYGASN